MRPGIIGSRAPLGWLARNAVDQTARIGMRRGVEYGINRTLFDDAARVHDRNTVSETRHNSQIMRDPHQCRAAFAT